MNVTPPVTPKNHHVARIVAEASMSASADEAKQNDGTADISVSMDDTWQKTGFSSLNGVVVAVSTSNFKVLDVEIMSRNYKACSFKEDLRKTDRVEYDKLQRQLRRIGRKYGGGWCCKDITTVD